MLYKINEKGCVSGQPEKDAISTNKKTSTIPFLKALHKIFQVKLKFGLEIAEDHLHLNTRQSSASAPISERFGLNCVFSQLES